MVLLIALIETRGTVVSKETLMERVWPNRVVDENALQAQIWALRTVFGADRDLVRTVPGRGYQFSGELRSLPARNENSIPGGNAAGKAMDEAATVPPSAVPSTNLPAQISELIGRDDEVRELLELTATHRFVTLVGPGGIGKTRLAVAVAHEMLPRFADGAWIAELAPLSDPGLVPAIVLEAAGIEPGTGAASPERVANALEGKQLLMVLDNCEHLITAAAATAEAVLYTGTEVHIIATSREPLRAEGELVFPVPSLSMPADEADGGDDSLSYGAAQLFLNRVRAMAPRFAPDRSAATAIAAVCRRLDGIPLAIELAAARATTLGLEQLAAQLDDWLGLLTGGRRTALPHQRTLRATLDWSFDLLPGPEQVVLRRLAVFAGYFGLVAASAVVASVPLTPSDAVEGIVNLVAKSLVSITPGATSARYRLLDTTRAYALEKLQESGEREAFARRHADYHRDLFEQAEAEWERQPSAEWLADYRRQIDNLRAALDWAFSPGGEAPLGVALTTAAVPLLMHMSLLEECRVRVERALATIGTETGKDQSREMKLRAALAASLLYTRGAVPEIGAAWTAALKIAEDLDDTGHQLRALIGLFNFHLNSGRSCVALALAERFCALARRRLDATDRLTGEQLMGVSQHLLGNQLAARHHFERIVADTGTLGRSEHDHVVRWLSDRGI